ncbi:cupin domain-containing protein [Pseudomonas viridiflava]|nr:cupin domain-containing protein [Pseudomonas viridiflava]
MDPYQEVSVIKEILGEIEFSDFAKTYLGKKCFLQRGVSKMGEHFNLDDFDQYLLQHEGSLQDKVRVNYKGSPMSVPAHIGMHESQRNWTLEKFRQGATLKLEELETRNPYFISLCSRVRTVFGGHVYAKPFLTGPGHKGLNVHFDTSEVFVIQLKGKKLWKIWERIIEDPVPVMQMPLSEETLNLPLMEIELAEGDILYMPSGTPHSAVAEDETSLHVGIGIDPPKIADVLAAYIKMLAERNDTLRTNIFPHSASQLLEKITTQAINDLHETPFSEMFERYTTASNATAANLSKKMLSTTTKAQSINGRSKIQIPYGHSLMSRRENGTIKVFPGGTLATGNSLVLNPTAIEFPDYCEEEIEYIRKCAASEIQISDIPGKLDLDSKVILCSSLVDAGALVIS